MDRYREALLRVGERVMTFGGFQRAERGEYWVSRNSVRACLDEELARADGSTEPKRAASMAEAYGEPTATDSSRALVLDPVEQWIILEALEALIATRKLVIAPGRLWRRIAFAEADRTAEEG